MAYLYINALKQVALNPSINAHPKNFNPTPTPPGEPYEKFIFTARERAAEYQRQLEDWINNH